MLYDKIDNKTTHFPPRHTYITLLAWILPPYTLTYRISVHPFTKGTRHSYKHGQQHFLPLNEGARALLVLTEPSLMVFSGASPATRRAASAILLSPRSCPAIPGYQQRGLELPVSSLPVQADGVLAPLLLLLAGEAALVPGRASPWHMADAGLPSAWCKWAARQ